MSRVGRRAYPLRKVIQRAGWNIGGVIVSADYLECGHVLPVTQDIIGEYYPERRRCHKCAKNKPKEVNADEMSQLQ